jgi:hypothetical protein
MTCVEVCKRNSNLADREAASTLVMCTWQVYFTYLLLHSLLSRFNIDITGLVAPLMR